MYECVFVYVDDEMFEDVFACMWVIVYGFVYLRSRWGGVDG